MRASVSRCLQLGGLFGELWFGFYRIASWVPPSLVVRAWSGPFGSPQDFNLPSRESYEVKTIHADSTHVRISSAEQLDISFGSLELAVVTITEVESSEPTAASLPVLVRQIEAMLTDNIGGVDELRARIRSLGVDVDDSYYDDYWFRVDECSVYRVDGSFPSIRRSALDATIDNVHYDIALYGIRDYRSSSWQSGGPTQQ